MVTESLFGGQLSLYETSDSDLFLRWMLDRKIFIPTKLFFQFSVQYLGFRYWSILFYFGYQSTFLTLVSVVWKDFQADLIMSLLFLVMPESLIGIKNGSFSNLI